MFEIGDAEINGVLMNRQDAMKIVRAAQNVSTASYINDLPETKVDKNRAVCCMCKSFMHYIDLPDGEVSDPLDDLSHGMCPKCMPIYRLANGLKLN